MIDVYDFVYLPDDLKLNGCKGSLRPRRIQKVMLSILKPGLLTKSLLNMEELIQ